MAKGAIRMRVIKEIFQKALGGKESDIECIDTVTTTSRTPEVNYKSILTIYTKGYNPSIFSVPCHKHSRYGKWVRFVRWYHAEKSPYFNIEHRNGISIVKREAIDIVEINTVIDKQKEQQK